MTVLGLLIIIQTFEMKNCFYMQSVRGRKRIDSTVLEEVATTVQEETSGCEIMCSLPAIA